MADVLLVGVVDSRLVEAIRRRGLRLTGVPHPACRAALVVGSCGEDMGLPRLALVSGESAVIAALDQGADDAADDRAPAAVIAARLAALVRRTVQPSPIRCGDLVIDRVERRVRRADRPIALLPREYRLLLFLVHHAGSVVPRALLREVVWGMDFDPGTNVIEVHVSRLRAKLDRGFAAPMVETVRGVGYRLAAPPAHQSPIAAVALAG